MENLFHTQVEVRAFIMEILISHLLRYIEVHLFKSSIAKIYIPSFLVQGDKEVSPPIRLDACFDPCRKNLVEPLAQLLSVLSKCMETDTEEDLQQTEQL